MFVDDISLSQIFIISYFPESPFLLSFYPYYLTELLVLSGSFEVFRVAMFEGVKFLISFLHASPFLRSFFQEIFRGCFMHASVTNVPADRVR